MIHRFGQTSRKEGIIIIYIHLRVVNTPFVLSTSSVGPVNMGSIGISALYLGYPATAETPLYYKFQSLDRQCFSPVAATADGKVIFDTHLNVIDRSW